MTKVRLGIGVAAVLLLALARCSTVYQDINILFQDREAFEPFYLSRFEEVRKNLPKRGAIGYVGDPKAQRLDYIYRHVLAAFALCPVHVHMDSADHDWVLVDAPDRISLIDKRNPAP